MRVITKMKCKIIKKSKKEEEENFKPVQLTWVKNLKKSKKKESKKLINSWQDALKPNNNNNNIFQSARKAINGDFFKSRKKNEKKRHWIREMSAAGFQLSFRSLALHGTDWKCSVDWSEFIELRGSTFNLFIIELAIMSH